MNSEITLFNELTGNPRQEPETKLSESISCPVSPDALLTATCCCEVTGGCP